CARRGIRLGSSYFDYW
nr:immunoglobulin heavy chain junction region [Mus musculus]MBK4187076.1 immunoglobulin heavy chain junction region [Mus musculus]